jgi:hypothetical protein
MRAVGFADACIAGPASAVYGFRSLPARGTRRCDAKRDETAMEFSGETIWH